MPCQSARCSGYSARSGSAVDLIPSRRAAMSQSGFASAVADVQARFLELGWAGGPRRDQPAAAIWRHDSAQRRQVSAQRFMTSSPYFSHSAAQASQTSVQNPHHLAVS
jgi:hypothetical protein